MPSDKADKITTASLKQLEYKEAFELVEYYEQAASVVKGRTWISAWILSINAALIAFCYSLETQVSRVFDVKLTIYAACFAGEVLSIVLLILILDQGSHLKGYWNSQTRAILSNADVYEFTNLESRPSQVPSSKLEAKFPPFCRNLIILTLLFVVAFAVTTTLTYVA